MDFGEMRLEQGLAPQLGPIITYRQIAAVRLLQLPSIQLEATVLREQVENPALEVDLHVCCPRCHTVLEHLGAPCPACGEAAGAGDRLRGDWDDCDEGPSGVASDDDGDDPIMRLPAPTVRGEALLRVLRLSVAGEDAEIAEYLVGSLDHHGFLPRDVVELGALELRCAPRRVAGVLDALQQLDPPGIGARGAQECLLIQLQRLREAGDAHPLAELLVREHLRELAFRHFREVAHAVGVMPKKIEAEWDYIRRQLHPFPAHGVDVEGGEIATCAAPIRPDVVIRRTEDGYSVEVVERQRYTLRVAPEYLAARKQIAALGASEGDRAHIRGHVEQAQSFIAALRQRWETMQRVTEALIDVQRGFLERGQTALQPLTRADIAQMLNLHESTVSRATDGKYVLLPNGRTVPFDDFFDSSLPVRKALTEIIATENVRKPYSDEQLVHLLEQRGLNVARRTIAKYREEMNILPSRLRRQRPIGRRRRAASVPAERLAVAAGAR